MPSPTRHPARPRRRLAAAARERVADEIEAGLEPIARDFDVVEARLRGDQRIAGPDRVAAAEFVRIETEIAAQFVDRRFDRERRLAQAVAAKGAGRRQVGIDGLAVDPLVGAAIERNGLITSV